jgi:hypothetical protein
MGPLAPAQRAISVASSCAPVSSPASRARTASTSSEELVIDGLGAPVSAVLCGKRVLCRLVRHGLRGPVDHGDVAQLSECAGPLARSVGMRFGGLRRESRPAGSWSKGRRLRG